MKYSQEFINKVKEIYFDRPTIIELVENGSDALGRYLDDNSNFYISPRMILDTPYEELIAFAEKALEKQELYHLYTTGACYDRKGVEEKMCPGLYMQNAGEENRYEIEEVLCKDAGFVSYFPKCPNWNCKGECWKKYYALKDGVK